MARGAEFVKRERAANQWVAGAHHAHILAVIQALVGKGDGFIALCAHHQVGQHGWKMTHCQVGLALIQQAARVARAQRQHTHGHAGSLALHDVDEPRHQLGGCRISHGQHEGRGGCSGLKTAGAERCLQLAQRVTHRRP